MTKSGMLSIQWQFVILCMSLVTIPAVILGVLIYGTFYQRSLERTNADLTVSVQDWEIFAESYIENQARILKREEFLVRKRLGSIALDIQRLSKVLDDQAGDLRSRLAEHVLGISIGRSGEVFVIDEYGKFVIPANGRDFIESIKSTVTDSLDSASDQSQIDAKLKQLQKLEAIGTLAAGIAHEINTPTQFIGDNIKFINSSIEDMVTLIKFYQTTVEKIEAQVKDERMILDIKKYEKDTDIEYLIQELPQSLEQTRDGLERVTKIVRAMKDFSHIGKDEKEMTDINRSIESTITVCRNEWKYEARLILELDHELPMIPCYTADLNQVIMNLVINAAHAVGEANQSLEREKGRICIATKQQAHAILISIADDGAGIEEKNQAKIFDPFFTTKEIGEGTGQGLSMAYRIIVEKHNGRIWFDSSIGTGTTFYINLPILSLDTKVTKLDLANHKEEAK